MTDPAVCNRCGQREVRVVAAKGREIGASIPIGFWSSAHVDHYVCTQCGHVEMRIVDRDKLATIAKKCSLAK